MGFLDSSVGKESACNAGDPGLIPGSGRSPGERIAYPLQSSWASLVAQLVKNLPAMQRPGFDPWLGKIPRRRESLPTPVFWPGEFHGLCSPWGRRESDTTERLALHFTSLSRPRTSGCSSKCMCGLHRASRVRLFETLWTVAHQTPLSMGLSRQEYWSGLPHLL